LQGTPLIGYYARARPRQVVIISSLMHKTAVYTLGNRVIRAYTSKTANTKNLYYAA